MTTVDVLVAYYTWKGHTERMAHAVAAGVASVEGARAVVRPIAEVGADDLLGAAGVILGSPTYLGSMAGPMKLFLDDWELRFGINRRFDRNLTGRVAGAFATEGRTGGGELVLAELLQVLLRAGLVGVSAPAGLGPIARTEDDVTIEAGCEAARALGARVARLAVRLGGAEV